MEHLRFNLNGTWVEERGLAPTTTLLRYLRDRRGLTGTKEGCAEGDCGACTVAVAERGGDGQLSWRAVNACLLLLPMVQGKRVMTVEALKEVSAGEGYHPAQVAMAQSLGSQCGYCTPGIVMSLFEATYRTDLGSAPWKIDDQLCGNLCRCTGYRPIRQAAQLVAGTRPDDRFSQVLQTPSAQSDSMALRYQVGEQRFVTPTTLEGLWNELEANPQARLIAGGTDVCLEITKRFSIIPQLVSLEGLSDFKRLTETTTGYRLGSGATISELEDFCEKRLPSVHRMVRYFGARQIKHRGTVGGNLCTASPIGDLAPVLLSLDATAVIWGRSGERRVPLEQFFVGYRKTALAQKEVLAAIEVPAVAQSARAVAYKVSKRRELDISTVSAAFYVDTDSAGQVTQARLSYGGMAAVPVRAKAAEAALLGNRWSEQTVAQAAKALTHDLSPLSDHRGSAAYRSLVAANFLKGFFEETRETRQPALEPGHCSTVQNGEAGVPHV